MEKDFFFCLDRCFHEDVYEDSIKDELSYLCLEVKNSIKPASVK